MNDGRCRLYLITPPSFEPRSFADTLKAALDGGDVAALQIRLKNLGDDDIRRAVTALLPIAHERDVALILNDRPDLALQTGCDGVHVGQDDAPYAEARRIIGPDRIVGVTCHNSRHLAMEAADAGADYVAFGAFFSSSTKEKPKSHANAELLRWWSELMTAPCVAIGGITVENCRELVAAGADFLAVSAGVWGYPAGPAAAVGDFNAMISRHSL